MPNDFVTVPNQKVVTISKEPCSKNFPFAMVNLYALNRAMKHLTNAEFEIWMYFAKNQNGYKFALSPADAERWGIARTTFNRTIDTFISHNYLVCDEEGSNKYTFHELPEVEYDPSTMEFEEHYMWQMLTKPKDTPAPWENESNADLSNNQSDECRKTIEEWGF